MTPRFEVHSFEQSPAGPGTLLLRVAGRWIGPSRERLAMPLLLINDGRQIHRLTPLPGPQDAAPLAGPDGPVWRAAFRAPAEVVDGPRAAYALQGARGEITELPRPAGHAAEPPPALDLGDLARTSDVSALHARLTEERAARENAEHRAAEAHSIAHRAATEAARAADLAAR
ncbi:MAG TPA: hypothetical protein VNT03_21545, partial [Baekduia sp.]|nr:hypothetical protein [Baekduia sp.]